MFSNFESTDQGVEPDWISGGFDGFDCARAVLDGHFFLDFGSDHCGPFKRAGVRGLLVATPKGTPVAWGP